MACYAGWADADEAARTRAWGVASEVLWRLTGRRFGVCPIVVRPCRRGGGERWPWTEWGWEPWATPYISWGGEWVNAMCGRHRDECGCTRLHEVLLPGPVDAVTAVWVDGVQLDPSAYTVYDHRRLVRVDGEHWPHCQDLTAPDHGAGAFAVEYGQGVPLGAAGQAAVEEYAAEHLKACLGQACRLPKRVSSISREGVTVDFIDPMDFLDKGRTGLLSVDTWIVSVTQAPQRSRVYSPDVQAPWSVTS